MALSTTKETRKKCGRSNDSNVLYFPHFLDKKGFLTSWFYAWDQEFMCGIGIFMVFGLHFSKRNLSPR